MDTNTKRKLIISGSIFVILNIFMLFSRSPFSIIPALFPTAFSYFMMSILPTSVTMEGKEISLRKLNRKTLLITVGIFIAVFIANSFSSIFGAIIYASLAATASFIAQIFICYKSYMKPVKPGSHSKNPIEHEKYDPLHDWNNPYSVYRSPSESFKAMDDSSRRNGS